MNVQDPAKIFLIDSDKIQTEILSFLLEREINVNVYRFFKIEESFLYLNLQPSIFIIDGDILRNNSNLYEELEKRKKEGNKVILVIYHKTFNSLDVPISATYEFHNITLDENYEDILYLVKFLTEARKKKLYA